MSRYIVLSGFLGSGKTTAMLAFSKLIDERGQKPAILVNDLGTKYLVDGIYTETSGFCCDEITGECICYQTDELLMKLRRFRDSSGADIIFSDIPGCGVGALDHVYHTMARSYPGEFVLCPFTAVADPERLRKLLPERAGLNLPDEMHFLFDAQLKEAEVILLNKIDTLTGTQRQEYLDFLTENYPAAKVFLISARTGEGIAEALDYLTQTVSTLPEPDIDFDSPLFPEAERHLCWYDRRFFVKSPSLFDGNIFLSELFEAVRSKLSSAGRNIPHMKVFADGEGGFAKASMLGIDYPAEFDCCFTSPQTELRAVINARATCESEILDFLMDSALKETCKLFGLKLRVFLTECFGMTDEGL